MDEPTNGLDAYMRKQFNDALLNTYEEDPRLIILSTHHIDEIEAMCEKIAIINQQTIVRYENTEELKMHGVLLSGSVKDRKSTRLNSSHVAISYAVFCLKKKKMK